MIAGHEQQDPSSAAGYQLRIAVPEAFRSWNIPYPLYAPPEYSKVFSASSGADRYDLSFQEFQQLQLQGRFDDSALAACSDPTSARPRNPVERTGLAGKGELYRWGANRAADFIVLRYDQSSQEPQVLLLQRRSGEWAAPGGFLDPDGETGQQAARRELWEETALSESMLAGAGQTAARCLYYGYAKDPRNTDHAWIETEVWWQQVDSTLSSVWQLQKSDESLALGWFALSKLPRLYAGHADYLQLLARQLAADAMPVQTSTSSTLPSVLLQSLDDLSSRGVRKLVLYGGSFDPVHAGHLAVAGNALTSLQADAVLFMPAKRNPLKALAPIANDAQRLRMLKAALSGHQGMLLSDWELQKPEGQPSFTIDTVSALRAALPSDAQLYLLIGDDQLAELSKWRNFQEIERSTTLVIQPRTGTLLEAPQDKQRIVLESSAPACSSTELRRQLSIGKIEGKFLLPEVAEILGRDNPYARLER
jgi:nicotinate (nicotinamide) nucleotide adenylyltransferase